MSNYVGIRDQLRQLDHALAEVQLGVDFDFLKEVIGVRNEIQKNIQLCLDGDNLKAERNLTALAPKIDELIIRAGFETTLPEAGVSQK